MTAFDIYSAVGGVGEDILEESEIMPKKKITKMIPLMAAAACFAVFAVGISIALRSDNIEQPINETTSVESGGFVTESNIPPKETDFVDTIVTEPADDEAETEPNTSAETSPAVTNYDTMPDPFGNKAEGTGGDENDGFYLPCNYIINNIPGSLLDLRDSNEVNKWLEKDKLISRSEAISSIKDYVNTYSFITEFNITREEAETALEYYIDDNYITYEHLDIIFSGDVELITKTFASELSIPVGDRIYTPHWLYTHSIEDYKAAGITAEDILSRVGSYRYILFTDEARQAFSEKLSAYTGETVVIETVVYEEKPEEPVHEAVAEDIMEDVSDEIVEEVEEVPEIYN